MPAHIPDYFTLARQCASPNQFNRLHIDLSDILAPPEIAGIAGLAGLPEPAVVWLERMRQLSPELFLAPKSFVRRAIEDRIMLYDSPDRPAGDKSLLVAFCGGAQRLMLPVSVFLQLLDCQAWNVVVVRKDKGTSYFDGLPGIAGDFPGLVRHVETVSGTGQYRRLVTLGTSAGGAAAIVAAVLMNAQRGISVGGAMPKMPLDPAWLRPGRHDLRFVYGAECARDRDSAVALLYAFGGGLHPVAACDTHDVLGPLLKRGQATALLDGLLE